MVEFKSWRDTYLFLLNYGKFSCLNCVHGGHNLDLTADNSEFAYSHKFCSKWVSMVDFSFQFLCEKWTDDEGNTVDGREDECAFDLPSEVLEAITDPKNGKWSFEEIKKLVDEVQDGYEEVSE